MFKKVKFLGTDKVEKCLSLVFGHFVRVDEFAIIEVCFSSEKAVRRLSDGTLKIVEVVPLPSYIWSRTLHVRIEEVPPDVEVAWVIAAQCKGRDNINILEVSKTAA